MSQISLSDVLIIVTLIGGIGGLWITIIKTIRTEVGRIEKYVTENAGEIKRLWSHSEQEFKDVRSAHSKSCNAFNREFVTKAELKERMAWNGDNRRSQ